MKTITEITGEPMFMAANRIGFGTGKSVAAAIENLKKETGRKHKTLWVLPAGSEVNGTSITYPVNAPFIMTQI